MEQRLLPGAEPVAGTSMAIPSERRTAGGTLPADAEALVDEARGTVAADAGAWDNEARGTVAADADALVDKAPPFSIWNEVRFFMGRGLPLCLSALLEWGAPPLVAMFFAGATPDSEELQAALGYGRLFHNCTLLLVLIGAGSYCWSVVPGCIGAGRPDRIPTYFRRGVLLTLGLITPSLLLQVRAPPSHGPVCAGVAARLHAARPSPCHSPTSLWLSRSCWRSWYRRTWRPRRRGTAG